MEEFIKPKKLTKGDTIATISLSGGSAGEERLLPWYQLAKQRLQKDYGLNVIESRNSLEGKQYIYDNPKARAEDLMEALSDPNIKAIFLNQGGDDGIRVVPYIDQNIIRDNPKIFLGFSDATHFHFMFYKAGITSFYGPNTLTTLSEPVQLHTYTDKWMKKVLFSDKVIGEVEASEFIVNEHIDWDNGFNKQRIKLPNRGYEILQGEGVVQGHLIGGALGPIVYNLKGTDLFPSIDQWRDSIVFLDSIIPYGGNLSLLHMLRGLMATKLFHFAKGVVFSGPISSENSEEKKTILKVFKEEGLDRLPILYNFNCGHIPPMNVLPYGVKAELNCDKCTFSILEPGVI